jgi:hypothetical protein
VNPENPVHPVSFHLFQCCLFRFRLFVSDAVFSAIAVGLRIAPFEGDETVQWFMVDVVTARSDGSGANAPCAYATAYTCAGCRGNAHAETNTNCNADTYTHARK